MGIFSRLFGGEVASAKPEVKTEIRMLGGDFSAFGEAISGLNQASELEKAILRNPVVAAGMRLNAEAISGATLRLYRRKKGGKDEEIAEHEALAVIRQPNPWHTGREILQLVSFFLDACGESFLYLDPKLKELTPLKPSTITPKSSKDGKQLIEYYERNIGGKTQKIDPEEVVHFWRPNPADFLRGASPLLSAAEQVDADNYAAKWNRVFFQNSAIPALIFIFKSALGNAAFQRLQAQWNKRHKGADKAHKVGMLEGEATIFEPSQKHSDMGFVQLSDVAASRILMALGVPPELVGIMKDANRASAEAAEYAYAKYSLFPKLQSLAERLNRDFLPVIAGTEKGLFFAYDDPTPENADLKLRTWDCLFSKGAITPNEIREQLGMKPLLGGDVAYLPFSVTPMGVEPEPVAEAPKVPAPEPETDENDPKKEGEKRVRTASDALVDAYLKRFTAAENNIAKKQRSLFSSQEAEVLRNIAEKAKAVRSMKPDDLLFSETEVNAETIRVMLPLLTQIFEQEGAAALDEAGLELLFRLDSPEVRDALKRLSERFAADVNSTTANRIREVLSAGIQAGEGADELAGRVKEVFTVAKKSRAVAIARTETLRAANSAHEAAYRQAGVQKWEWLSVMDGRSGRNHEDANGQVREIGKPFEVNGELMLRPGEGSAANVVNCRCRTVAVI